MDTGAGVGGAIGQGPFAGHAPGSYSQALSTERSTHSQAHVLSPLPQPPVFPRSLSGPRPTFGAPEPPRPGVVVVGLTVRLTFQLHLRGMPSRGTYRHH